MSRRKGELSRAAIDRDFAHQVAVHAERCRGAGHLEVHEFLRGTAVCTRTFTIRRDDRDMLVFCFSEPEDARAFAARFDGRMVDPRSRPRWPGRGSKRR